MLISAPKNRSGSSNRAFSYANLPARTGIATLLPLGVDCLTFGVKSLRIDEFIAAGTNGIGRVRYSAGLISQRHAFKSHIPHVTPHDNYFGDS